MADQEKSALIFVENEIQIHLMDRFTVQVLIMLLEIAVVTIVLEDAYRFGNIGDWSVGDCF